MKLSYNQNFVRNLTFPCLTNVDTYFTIVRRWSLWYDRLHKIKWLVRCGSKAIAEDCKTSALLGKKQIKCFILVRSVELME